jgi:hypothetical protein
VVKLIYNLYLRLRILLDKKDFMFRMLVIFISWFRASQIKKLAGPKTSVIIEGFPRSANTFFTSHFYIGQSHKPVIAHHLHASYQIRYGEKYGIPTVILLREPLQAIASAILRNDKLYPSTLFEMYIAFYKEVLRVHKKAIIVDFRYCIDKPNNVIKLLNLTYDKNFELVLPENNDSVLNEINQRDNSANVFGNSSQRFTKSLPSEEKKKESKLTQVYLTQKYPRRCDVVNDLYNEVMRRCNLKFNNGNNE